MILLGAAAACATFVGLAGVNSSLAFVTSDVAFSLYAVVGVMLIGFNDYSYRRRPIRLSVAPVVAIGSGRFANACGLSRRDRIAA
jgi:hypothetical protein